MYVCFGFSVARLRRARTIDLVVSRSLSVELFCFVVCVAHSLTSSKDDRPAMSFALSLRQAFLLHIVCLSCMSIPVITPYWGRFFRCFQNNVFFFRPMFFKWSLFADEKMLFRSICFFKWSIFSAGKMVPPRPIFLSNDSFWGFCLHTLTYPNIYIYIYIY